jgi:type III secretion protein HrpB1
VHRSAATPAGASYGQCRDEVVGLLLKIFSLGLKDAPREDLEDILLALRVLRREAFALDLGEVRLRIREADWIGAVRLLKRLESADKSNAASIALLAGCLFKLHDDEWRRYVANLLRDGANGANAAALALVSRFIETTESVRQMPNGPAVDDLRTRIADVLRTGGMSAY